MRHPEICLHDPKRGSTRGLRANIPFSVNLDGRVLEVELENMRQYKRWRRAEYLAKGNSAEEDGVPDPAAVLLRSMRTDDVLYDIGANIGVMTAIAAASAPDATVLSFEPEPNSFLHLCRMIRKNGLNAVPYPFAISDQTHVDRFFVNTNFEPGLSQHQFGRTVDYSGASFNPDFALGTAAFSIDDLVEVYGLPRPTILKIDVDGIEPKVISGAKQTIASGAIHTIVVETSDRQVAAGLSAEIEQLGMTPTLAADDFPDEGSFDLVFAK